MNYEHPITINYAKFKSFPPEGSKNSAKKWMDTFFNLSDTDSSHLLHFSDEYARVYEVRKFRTFKVVLVTSNDLATDKGCGAFKFTKMDMLEDTDLVIQLIGTASNPGAKSRNKNGSDRTCKNWYRRGCLVKQLSSIGPEDYQQHIYNEIRYRAVDEHKERWLMGKPSLKKYKVDYTP